MSKLPDIYTWLGSGLVLTGALHRATCREAPDCGRTEALILYATQRPDVVLMDIQMAVIDGLTATRRIRAADPAAQVIMVSDHDQSDLREAARQAGACGYLVKDNLPELIGLLQVQDT